MKYKIDKSFFENVYVKQREIFEDNFLKDEYDNIEIQVEHKGYTCNDKEPIFIRPDVQAISFFSGAGGLDIGAQLAGVKVIASLDFYEDSVETLKANKYFEHTKHFCEDIKNIKGEDFKEILEENKPEKLILIGGPPCQPFSKAGYWVTNDNRKANDDPRNMIGQYFRLIQEISPDGFILENVESILHPSNKPAVEEIEERAAQLGYNLETLKVNSADFGVPQKRKRVFFVGSKNEITETITPTHGTEKEIFIHPDLKPYERVVDWIAKFDNGSYYGEEVDASGKYFSNLTAVPPGKNYIALSERAGYPDPQFLAGKRYWSFLLKLHPLLPSWTIIASPGHWEGPFHWKNRRLSIREAAAIQTFPEDYVFKGAIRSQRKQIGNAVPPILGKNIVEYLCRWI